jgi:hypothetical protein
MSSVTGKYNSHTEGQEVTTGFTKHPGETFTQGTHKTFNFSLPTNPFFFLSQLRFYCVEDQHTDISICIQLFTHVPQIHFLRVENYLYLLK